MPIALPMMQLSVKVPVPPLWMYTPAVVLLEIVLPLTVAVAPSTSMPMAALL